VIVDVNGVRSVSERTADVVWRAYDGGRTDVGGAGSGCRVVVGGYGVRAVIPRQFWACWRSLEVV
jgi:hypothetical protein